MSMTTTAPLPDTSSNVAPLLQLRTTPLADPDEAERKLEELRALLRALGGIIIGYSGGVDSAFLAKVAQEELGERAVAVVALSESYAAREREAALELAEQIGVRLRTVRTSELENENYAANPTNRCYFCKEELFVHLRRVSDETGIPHIAYGAIADDRGDHRPGAEAAEKYGARAPLQEVGLWKREIRLLSSGSGCRPGTSRAWPVYLRASVRHARDRRPARPPRPL
jgi:uncharacterized protein